MYRAFVFLIAGVLLLSGGVVQAATLSPELLQRMEATEPGGKVPVIIHFADRLDLQPFAHRRDRAAARAAMVRGLRDQARRSQGPLQGFLRQQGVEPSELWLINALAVRVPPALVATLAAWPGVAAVEIDGQVAPPAPVTLAVTAPPSDNLAALGVASLWAAGFTGSGVVVASFDSGVDRNHPTLAARWRGLNGGTNSWFDPYATPASPSPFPTDAAGHGTATTSLMVGGATPLSFGGKTLGVAPDAQWIAAKIFPDTGAADNSKIHLAFQWALDPDGNPATDDAPDVINNSWGFEDNPNQCTNPGSFLTDIQALQAAGIMVVFSAGNSGPAAATSVSPANYPEGLAVGSIGPGYAVSRFSARGPGACSGGSIYTDLTVDVYPEIVAPGEAITVAYPGSVFSTGYAVGDGTSFSAPQVSGALALLRSAVPPLINEPAADYRLRLEQALLTSSSDLGPLGADNSYGRGIINLPAAYARLTTKPFLSIYDPAAPENDDHLDFGSITPGTATELDFVLKNSGGAARDINLISNTLSAPALTLVANNCPAALPPGAQCTLTIRFAPAAFARSSGQLVINGDDPQQPLRTLTVTGIGNSLPPPAQLLAPANNATGLASPVTFSWIQGVDLDGDTITQTLLLDINPHFTNARTIIASVVGTSGILLATTGFFLWPLSGRRRQLLVAGGLVLLGLMVACGGGGGGDGGTTARPTDSVVVPDLSPATTYYWKVRTEDTRGGVSESEVRSFTTR